MSRYACSFKCASLAEGVKILCVAFMPACLCFRTPHWPDSLVSGYVMSNCRRVELRPTQNLSRAPGSRTVLRASQDGGSHTLELPCTGASVRQKTVRLR